MFNVTFFNDTLRKYTAVIGTLFNNIHLYKSNTDGTIEQLIKVPITYAPTDKMNERLRADPDFARKFAIQLPRMSYEIVDLEYDATRKLQTTIKIPGQMTANGSVSSVYQPVPYNVTYRLSVMVKNATDGTRIIEQILPYFTPDWCPTVELIPELGLKYDIPIELSDTSLSDSYEGSMEENRVQIWTLMFKLRGYLFGPVKTGGGVIKFVKVNFHENLSTNTVAEAIHVKPGLTANGEPTTNSKLSIPYLEINKDDDWDYIVSIVNE